MSFSHMIILAIIVIVFVPADKLPDFARNVARFLNDIRRQTAGVWDDIKKDAAYKPIEKKNIPDLTVPNISAQKDESKQNDPA